VPDIFVEVDWMAGHEMSNEAVGKVVWPFARHGIALHIDRGEMGGGGEQITHDENTNSEERTYIYTNYFLHGNSDNPRNRIFHYGFYAHYEDGDHETLGLTFGLDRFAVWDQANAEYANSKSVSHCGVSTCTFMHELGHTLGLDRDYLMFTVPLNEYPSCMNYNSVDLVDYSDGTHSSRDFDDWEELNLSYFNS
jgi:hypothetical protein